LAYTLLPLYDHALLLMRVSGTVTAESIQRSLDAATVDLTRVAAFDTLMLVDPDADFSRMSREMAERILAVDRAAFGEPVPKGLPPKLAVVCMDEGRAVAVELYFGVSDAHAAAYERKRRFDTVDAALAWLDRRDPAVIAAVERALATAGDADDLI